MLQLLNSRLVAAAVGVAELELERSLVASLEQEIGMRWDMLVEVVGLGLRVKWRRVLEVGVASVPGRQRTSSKGGEIRLRWWRPYGVQARQQEQGFEQVTPIPFPPLVAPR